MGTLHFLGQPPPVEYTVRVAHHYNGNVEVTVEGVGSSREDREKKKKKNLTHPARSGGTCRKRPGTRSQLGRPRWPNAFATAADSRSFRTRSRRSYSARSSFRHQNGRRLGNLSPAGC